MTHDVTTMLYNLLLGTYASPGIVTTADDGSTVLSPNIDFPSSTTQNQYPGDFSALIYVKLHPYQPEANLGIQEAVVVVGPARGASADELVGYTYSEMVQNVEVRVFTRYADSTVEGYQTTEIYRRKIVDSIKAVVKANNVNPDGTGTYNKLEWGGLGSDADKPQGVPLYVTPVLIRVTWLE